MTSRIDALIPATRHARPMSDSEAARAEADARQHADSRRRATRVVAACASGAAEFRALADMLGLEHADIVAARDDGPSRPGRSHAARDDRPSRPGRSRAA